MKRLSTILLSIAVLGMSGCIKDVEPFDHTAQLAIDKLAIEKFVNENNLQMQKHEKTGIYYRIINGPSGSDQYTYRRLDETQLEVPVVTVKYKGRLLDKADGTVFDENKEGFRYSLAGLIVAWQFMFFPEIVDGVNIGGITPTGLQPGHKVEFITPSYYAYREIGQGSVPANAPIRFEIEVVKIEAPSTNPLP